MKTYKDMKIIEYTWENIAKEDSLYGTSIYYLTDEYIKALEEGKCISTSINDEYRIFIVKE